MSRSVIIALVAAVLLAGCAKSPDDPDDDAAPDPGGSESGVDDAAPTLELGPERYGLKPLWFAGLEWTYDMTFPGRDVSGPMRITVLGTEDAFQLTGNATDDVMAWSLFYHLPPLGPVDGDGLVPIIHGAPVEWYRFPLVDGGTWSAPDHHGTTVNYTASETQARIPGDRTVPAYEVVGERQGSTWIRYVYTSEVGWFVEAEVDGSGDGVIDARMQLTTARVNSDYAGERTFEPQEGATHVDVGAFTVTQEPTSFQVPDATTTVYVFFVGAGGPGHFTATVSFGGNNIAEATESRTYNWTNAEQTGSLITADQVHPVPGAGAVETKLLGQGFLLVEVVPVIRQAAPT